MSENDIIPVTSAPYHRASNGLAEGAVQTFTRGLKTTKGDSLQERQSMCTTLSCTCTHPELGPLLQTTYLNPCSRAHRRDTDEYPVQHCSSSISYLLLSPAVRETYSVDRYTVCAHHGPDDDSEGCKVCC